MTITEIKKELETIGFECSSNKYGRLEGRKDGVYFLYGDDNGCGVIDKPNGTNKWYYHKSCKQFLSIIKRVVECN